MENNYNIFGIKFPNLHALTSCIKLIPSLSGLERNETDEKIIYYKKFNEKIQSCYLKNTSTLKPFSIFEEYGNYYIVLPKEIEFDNSVGIFNNPEFSSYKLSKLSKFALEVIDYSGYAMCEINQYPIRILGGTTFDFSLSKYEKANPELAKATLDYHKEYTKLVKNLIKEGFVFPVLGISWTKAMETDKSTKELIEIVAKELKELL